MPITLNGDTGIQTPMYNGTITANAVTPSVNMKNRIINGDMTIDQRNAGASFSSSTNGAYNLDRWYNQNNSGGTRFTVQQDAGAVTPPVGFRDYLGVTSTSAYSVASTDVIAIGQKIEGFNTSDLMWGTANARAVTISFWVRSSLTGTFGGSVSNNDGNRFYPYSYTISAANTWEYKTVTVAGDTTGTWNITTGAGIQLLFNLGTGATYSGAAGSWTGSAFYAPTGATSVVGTNGATFYITGVQLEVGSTATSFDYRPYGTELQLCQRYYDFMTGGIGGGNQTSSTNCGFSLSFRVPKRAAPTPSLVGTVNVNDGSSQVNISSLPSYFYGDANGILINFTTASLTANRPTLIYSQSSTAGLALSAEL